MGSVSGSVRNRVVVREELGGELWPWSQGLRRPHSVGWGVS